MICMYGNITGMWNDKWTKYNKLPKHTERQTASVFRGNISKYYEIANTSCKVRIL